MPEARPVSASVTVNFGLDEADTEITLERSIEATGQDPYEGWQSVREFPVLFGVTRAASVGEVIDTGRVEQLLRDEYVTFSGNDTSSLRYPVVANFTVEINLVFGFDLDGNEIFPSQIAFSVSNQNKTLRATRPFYGAIQIRYYTEYRILAYRPVGGRADIDSAGFLTGAYFRRFGTILSFYNQKAAILDMDPNPLDNWSLRKEIYVVFSVVQVNENGPWEKHPNFDTGGSWGDGAPVDGDSIFEYERPHEIGYLVRNSHGQVDFETKTILREQGPSDPFFQPQLEVRIQPRSSFENTPWLDAYDRLSITSMENDILSRWPDVEFD